MASDTAGPPVGPSPGEHPETAGQAVVGPAEAGEAPEAAGDLPSGTATDGPEPAPKPEKHRRLLYLTLPGCWGALIFGCLSFTPSLLPRGGVVQGLVFGITAAIGYGLGVWAASIWRAFADREPRQPRRSAWLTFFIAGAVLYVVGFALEQYWQH